MDVCADESFETRNLLRFYTAEVNLRSEDLVSPCSGPANKQVAGGGCKEIRSHEEDILTLNVNKNSIIVFFFKKKKTPEEDTVQDAERVKAISNPGQPSKKEREEHEATHAQYRSWCSAYVRGRGIAMKHHRSAGAESDEIKLHTFVMDYCFPSQVSQQGITVLVTEETKTKAISTFTVPNGGASKAVTDFMSGCGCGRTILKSDGELATVALQEAVKNSGQSDTIQENSPKGDSQSN